MTDAVAKLAAATFVFLLVAGLATLYITSRGASGTEVQAEFTDAFAVLEGLDVRIDAAPAGTVDGVELTDRGTAMVTLTLYEGVEPPSDDASVAIRQQDLLGDTYVALNPGDSGQPLEEPIRPSRSISAPRFDDILTTFRQPVREALGVLVTEAGLMLDRRGEDLNEAILQLRPGLAALDDLTTELDAQNGALRSLIADAEHVTDQAQRRSADLGPSIDALATTLSTTAARTPALDSGLRSLPAGLGQARQTLDRLAVLTERAQPAAVALHEVAPELEQAGQLLGPFLDDAEAAADDLRPTLDLARAALRVGEPTLRKLAQAVPVLRATVPPLADLVEDLRRVRRPLGQAFFGADAEAGGSSGDEVGLGAVATEKPEPVAGFSPDRRITRIQPIFSCESFGVPIEPGCLDAIAFPTAAGATGGRAGDARPQSAPADGREAPPGAYARRLLGPVPGEALGRQPAPRPRAGGGEGGAARGARRRLERLRDRARDGGRAARRRLDDLSRSPRGGGPPGNALDFLLGP